MVRAVAEAAVITLALAAICLFPRVGVFADLHIVVSPRAAVQMFGGAAAGIALIGWIKALK